MRDVLTTLLSWKAEKKSFALARVVSTWGSAPRRVGACMLISDRMEVAGSVSGGCIEGSVIEAALKVLESGKSQLLEYGVDDEKAWSVGLSCGGQIKVHVETWSSIEESLQSTRIIDALQSNKPFVLVSNLSETDATHELVDSDSAVTGAEFGDSIDASFETLMREGSRLVSSAGTSAFIHVFSSRRHLIIVGGADITVKLLNLAILHDFETTVIDPRAVFTDPSRFETAPDTLITRWPQEVMAEIELNVGTYAVLLTHDPKIDDPALHALLNSTASYIGALGGSRTQQKRKDRMKDAGFSDEQIDRIHGPVGLDIDASDPGEIALSIMAEIISVKNAVGEKRRQ